MGDTCTFLEEKRRLFEGDVYTFIVSTLQHAENVSYVTNTRGEIIGGRAWVNDQYCHYCVTDEFIFTTHRDAIVTSELFTESAHDALVDFFIEGFSREQEQ